MEDPFDEPPAPVSIPIDGCLDLHTFPPSEVREVVEAYLEACREVGILQVRIVHGKGTGALRRGVHALLGRIPWIVEFHAAGSDRGAWGATVVTLEGLQDEVSES
ncbi:MAG: DNA-nicking Smr family endonuclease [Hyphomicrobiaceae bacterium]